VPLESAPVTLEGRRIFYAGAEHLAFNGESSTKIRQDLAAGGGLSSTMLYGETARIAHAEALYTRAPSLSHSPPLTTQAETIISPTSIPPKYAGCEIIRRPGLQNGLLSESSIFEIRSPEAGTVAFMKMLPPQRDPANTLRDEADGLALFNRLELKNATAPRAELLNDPISLWVERAPGVTIGTHITNYERGLLSEEDVYAALRSVGEMLSDLHSRFPQAYNERAARYVEAYIRHYETVIENADPTEASVPSVIRAIEEFRFTSTELRKKGLRCSWLHGDANCGNLLWDPATKKLSAIDLQRLGTQARTGSVGFSTFEYLYFENSLRFYPNIGFRGLRGGLEAAKIAYRDGYGDVDPLEERFFRSMWAIRWTLAGHERVQPIQESNR
jgi:hypothetical protein